MKTTWHPIEYAGQWNINDEPFYEANNVLSADDVGEDEAEKNALLASCAPELLEACQRSLSELSRLKKYTDDQLLNDLSAAISKALNLNEK